MASTIQLNTTSALLQPPAPTTAKPKKEAQKKAARERFNRAYDIIKHELIEQFKAHSMPPDAVEWWSRSLDYNVPGGKLNRGLSVIDTVQIIKGRELSDDEYLKAAVLGWAIEILQAYFLVSDDLMDESVIRRGQPCWYRLDGVGTIAVNDALMLEGAIYQMLRTHFKGEPYYTDLLEMFHDVSYMTEMGQLIDLITAPVGKVDLSKFNLERHSLIVVYKTAFYSFYLPVAAAMYMCNIPSSASPLIAPSSPLTPVSPSAELEFVKTNGDVNGNGNEHATKEECSEETDPYKIALSILLPLGEYFQVQDDFLDFAGTPEQIGKVGTDIIDNKCSWCVNTALALASPAQRDILDTNYGRKNPDCEKKVKAVFEEVGVRQKYEEYEAAMYEKLTSTIARMPEVRSEKGDAVLRREVFTSFLEKIYKRQK